MRIWGSIAFLGGNFIGGIILAATSADAVPVMISAWACRNAGGGADRAAPRPAARASPLSADRPAGFGAKTAQPLFPAVRRRRRRHQRQPRLPLRLRLDLLEDRSASATRDRLPLGAGRSSPKSACSWSSPAFSAGFGDDGAGDRRRRRDRALDRLSADRAARPRRCRASSPSRRCMRCRPGSC